MGYYETCIFSRLSNTTKQFSDNVLVLTPAGTHKFRHNVIVIHVVARSVDSDDDLIEKRNRLQE